MEIEFDEGKRLLVLAERGLDFNDAVEAFSGFHLTRSDLNHSGKEERFHSLGMVRNELVLIVWTHRGTARRIITMWKANEKERQGYEQRRPSG